MSGVTDLKTASGNAMTGEITLISTQPALLQVSNTPNAPYTINFAAVAGGTNTVAGKNGDVVFNAQDGCLSFTPDSISPAIKFNAYNAGSNTSGLVANNVSGSLAWVASNAYAVGAVVKDSGSTYMCLTAQPASSPAPTVGSNWVSLGGGGTSGGSSITNGNSSVVCASNSDITIQAGQSASNVGSITIQPGSNAPVGSNAGQLGAIYLENANAIIISTQNAVANPLSGVRVLTNNTKSQFDFDNESLVSGVITMATMDSNAASVRIGGASTTGYTDVGLWVGKSSLLYNGSNVIGGGGSSISQAGGSVAVDSNGNITATTPATGTFTVGGANSTSLLVSATSGIQLLNSGSNNSASLTMFNDQSNTYRSELNTTAVLGYTPTVAGASNLVVLQGGGSNSNAYADFGAGSFQILGQSATPLTPVGGATVPFITASQTNAGTASNTIVMTLNAGTASNVASNATLIDIVADDIKMVDGNSIASSIFFPPRGSATSSAVAETNGVVIFSPNTTTTFGVANGQGFTDSITFNTAGSNSTKLTVGGASNNSTTGLWVGPSNLLYNNLDVRTNITNDGSTLSIDSNGSMNFTTTNVTGNTNQLNFTTTIPSSNAGTDAADINFTSDANINLMSKGIGGINIQTKSGDVAPPLTITPGQGNENYIGGAALFNCLAFNGSKGYGVGSVVQDGAGSYIAKNNIAPSTGTPNQNPSQDPSNWTALGGGGGGGGITGITIAGGSAVPTSGSTVNFQPGAGIVMSNSGSNSIAISASPNGTGAYLTDVNNSWEWLGSNSYATAQGVVSYQGGLYANILAPTTNVAPFGASNSTTIWQGLAPSLSVSPAGTVAPTNVAPLPASASNAYTYVLQPGSSNVSIAGSNGVFTFDVAPPVQPVITIPTGSNVALASNAWLFNSTDSNVNITNPSTNVVDFTLPGAVVVYKGAYSASNAYVPPATVLFEGTTYLCVSTTTAGQSPFTSPNSWQSLGVVGGRVTNAETGYVPQMYNIWAGTQTTFNKNDIIGWAGGSIYQCLTNGVVSNTPPDVDTTNWVPFTLPPTLVYTNLTTPKTGTVGTLFPVKLLEIAPMWPSTYPYGPISVKIMCDVNITVTGGGNWGMLALGIGSGVGYAVIGTQNGDDFQTSDVVIEGLIDLGSSSISLDAVVPNINLQNNTINNGGQIGYPTGTFWTDTTVITAFSISNYRVLQTTYGTVNTAPFL